MACAKTALGLPTIDARSATQPTISKQISVGLRSTFAPPISRHREAGRRHPHLLTVSSTIGWMLPLADWGRYSVSAKNSPQRTASGFRCDPRPSAAVTVARSDVDASLLDTPVDDPG